MPTAEPGSAEARAFGVAMGVGVLCAIGLALLGILPGAPLRDAIPEGAPAVNALHSFFEAIEILVTIGFIIPGIVYGILTKTITSDKDLAKMMSDTMASMGAYVVLAFVAGQFVAYFNWTNLGAVTAVKGAGLLQSIGLQGGFVIGLVLIVSSLMNLLVGSASAKWGLWHPSSYPCSCKWD